MKWILQAAQASVICMCRAKILSLRVATQELLAAIESGPWESAAGRRVQHYGHRFEYMV